MSSTKTKKACRTMSSIYVFKFELVTDNSDLSQSRTEEAKAIIAHMIESGRKRGRPTLKDLEESYAA